MRFLKDKKVVLVFTVIVVFVGIIAAVIAMKNGVIFSSLPSSNSTGTKTMDRSLPINEKNYTPDVSSSNGPVLESDTNFETKIIKRADISLTVEQDDFLEVFDKLQSVAKTFGGYIKSSSYGEYKNKMSGSIDVMVPSDRLNDFLNSVGKFGKIDRMNLSSRDVSGEYVDLSSRISVLNAQKDMLLSWLKKAKTIDEMLKIRSQLEQIETNIETLKGRIKYINFHSSYSEVYISINQNKKIPSPLKEDFINLLRRAGSGVVYSLGFFLVLVAWLIPYLLAVTLVYFIWKRNKK